MSNKDHQFSYALHKKSLTAHDVLQFLYEAELLLCEKEQYFLEIEKGFLEKNRKDLQNPSLLRRNVRNRTIINFNKQIRIINEIIFELRKNIADKRNIINIKLLHSSLNTISNFEWDFDSIVKNLNKLDDAIKKLTSLTSSKKTTIINNTYRSGISIPIKIVDSNNNSYFSYVTIPEEIIATNNIHPSTVTIPVKIIDSDNNTHTFDVTLPRKVTAIKRIADSLDTIKSSRKTNADPGTSPSEMIPSQQDPIIVKPTPPQESNEPITENSSINNFIKQNKEGMADD